MSESTISILIAAAILVALALFIPCMESLARLLRNRTRKTAMAADRRSLPRGTA